MDDPRAVARAAKRLLHHVVPGKTVMATGWNEEASSSEQSDLPCTADAGYVEAGMNVDSIAGNARPDTPREYLHDALTTHLGRDVSPSSKKRAFEADPSASSQPSFRKPFKSIATVCSSGSEASSDELSQSQPGISASQQQQQQPLPDAQTVRSAIDKRDVAVGAAFLRQCHQRLTKIVADAVLAKARNRVYLERKEEAKRIERLDVHTNPSGSNETGGCARLVSFTDARAAKARGGISMADDPTSGKINSSKKSLAELTLEKSAESCFGGERVLESPQRRVHTRNQAGEDADETSLPLKVTPPPSPVKGKSLKGDKGVKRLRLTETLFRVDKSSVHGFGVFPRVAIPANVPVIEYVGEVIRRPVADKRERAADQALNEALNEKVKESNGGDQRKETKRASTYMFALDEHDVDSRVVDAQHKGNIARYVNHSCNPNCYTKNVTLHNKKRVVIFTKKEIKKGEELSYDYRFAPETPELETKCGCGAQTCRGVINVRG